MPQIALHDAAGQWRRSPMHANLLPVEAAEQLVAAQASSISPWVVTLDALQPFRCAASCTCPLSLAGACCITSASHKKGTAFAHALLEAPIAGLTADAVLQYLESAIVTITATYVPPRMQVCSASAGPSDTALLERPRSPHF